MTTNANSNSHTTTSSSSTASTSSNCSTSILLPAQPPPHPSLTLLHFNPATNLTNTSLAAYNQQAYNVNTLNKIALVYTPNKMASATAAANYPAYFVDQQQNYANNFADDSVNSPEQVYELIDDNSKSSESNNHHFHHNHHGQPVVLLVNSDQLTQHHLRTSTLHLSQRKYPKTNPNFTLSKK